MKNLPTLSEILPATPWAESAEQLRPPPKLTLSEWADRNFYLSAESSAEAGPWKTLPYQREMMDAFTDPRVEQVWVIKSARIGWTKIINALTAYHIEHDPCPVMVVQPTVDDAKGYSKEEIAPMLRDCPSLAKIVFDEAEESGPKDGGNTILHKRFPGGVLSLVGANSGTGFRRTSRRVVLFDEVDAYPPSAGSDGDQIKLGMKRSEYYWNRKVGGGSTPLIAGASRIEALFESGDQRRYFVPCPQCDHMAPLVFSGDAGHVMRWPDGKPEAAFFECQKNGCVIEHHEKREIVTRGEWRAAKPFTGVVSFHIWAAYSFSPNASWGQLAAEFIDAKRKGPETLKTFVNTVLGETWKDLGEAPDWERLYQRREPYPIASVPEGVVFLTAGVDVQKDRWVYEVVGWGLNKESWSVDAGVIPGDPSDEREWTKVDALLGRTYRRGEITLAIALMGIDSGYNTQTVYNWARRYVGRVIATKGVPGVGRTLLGTPTSVDVTFGGQRIARGCKMWPVGVDLAKAELYGWLRQKPPLDGRAYPVGWCHFPEYDPEFFRQLTGEQLVTRVNERTHYPIREWQLIPGRENHFLDARVNARAAAALGGLDRMAPKPVEVPATEAQAAAVASTLSASSPPPPPPRQSNGGGWLGKGGPGITNHGKRSWLKR
jgi:phage terminase large subunit GpA-like protein